MDRVKGRYMKKLWMNILAMFGVPIRTKHFVCYCNLCEADMVVCATCGNNCCNGGYGEVDGKQCHDCPNAYDVEHILWRKGEDAVMFAGRKDPQ